MSLFEELKRRKVIRVGIAYVIGAWLLLQLTDVLSELLSLPASVGPIVVALVALGLPVALFLSWAYEITADGIKRDSEVSPDKRSSGKFINMVVVGLLLAALGYFIWESRFSAAGVSGVGGVSSEQPAAEEIGRSIAVLPFENFSGKPEDEYFADGLTDTLLHKLAQIAQLKVIARNSTFQFKGTNKDVREIGQILNVDTVLEGSVQRAGEQVRVIAQLVRTSDGAHIWSQSFDDSMDNIFSLQDRIAASIVDAFQLTLSAAERQRLLRDGTDNPVAYDLLIRALNTRRSIDELIDASDQDDEKVALIRQAIAEDPNYALAWAELSFAYNGLAFAADSALDEDRYVAEAQTAADEAYRLDPGLADALNALGWVAHRKSETLKATGHFRKALEIDPNDLGAMSGLALQLGRSDPEAMLELLNRSLELDPTAALVYRQKHFALMGLGRRAEAIEQLKKAIELAPDAGIFYNDLGDLLVDSGRPDESAVWTTRLLRLSPGSFDGQLAMAEAWLAGGNFDRAAEWIELALAPRPDSDTAKALEARRLLAAREYQRALAAVDDINTSEYGGYQGAILTGSACMGLRQAECARQSNGQVLRLLEEAKAQGSAMGSWNVLPALAELLIAELETPGRDRASEARQLQASIDEMPFGFDAAWYVMAGLAARIHETDQAFDYLEQAITDPQGAVFNSDIFGLGVADSLFLDPLREDARFTDWFARYQARHDAMLERMDRLERAGEIIEPATVARAGAS